MRKSQLVAFLLLTATFALTACGQKGALYLPAGTTAESAQAAAAEVDKDAKKQDAPAAGSSY